MQRRFSKLSYFYIYQRWSPCVIQLQAIITETIIHVPKLSVCLIQKGSYLDFVKKDTYELFRNSILINIQWKYGLHVAKEQRTILILDSGTKLNT